MPGIQTIDPSASVLTVGPIKVQQFKKGTYIEVEYDSDAYTDDVSADGIPVRIKSADFRGTVKITLDRASPTNTAFSALALSDRGGPGAPSLPGVTLPMFCQDTRGTTLASAPNCWIKKIPAAKYATENTEVVWEIRCGQLSSMVGGILPV